jgi:hypothetical protein
VALTDPAPDPGDPTRLAKELQRTVDRLRTMSAVRLAAPLPDGRSRAAAACALAQRLTDRAARLAGRPLRSLPDLPDLAAGDVLAVCGHDLLEQVRIVADRDACRIAVDELIALRRVL